MAQWALEGMKVYGRQDDILRYATLQGQAVFNQTNNGYPATTDVKTGVQFGQFGQLTGSMDEGGEYSVVF